MEFAEGGDMEEACKLQPKLMFAVEQLPCLVYQMLFSLYSAQVRVDELRARSTCPHQP